MRRVMIIGQPGSGKSTLARTLGGIVHLPVIHMDQIHWRPGWQETGHAARTKLTLEAHRRDRWIFEGGHSATWQDRLDHADTLIWLDFPLWRRVPRLVRRTMRWWGRTRPDMKDVCPERFRPEFLRFVWHTRHSARSKMAAFVAEAREDLALHHLRTPREVTAYLNALRNAVAVGNLGVSHR